MAFLLSLVFKQVFTGFFFICYSHFFVQVVNGRPLFQFKKYINKTDCNSLEKKVAVHELFSHHYIVGKMSINEPVLFIMYIVLKSIALKLEIWKMGPKLKPVNWDKI